MKKQKVLVSLQRQRQIIIWTLSFLTLLGVYWYFFSNGLPIFFGPSAKAKDVAAGKMLFEHEWTANDPLAHGDGLGPVFNAKSCASCHFQGGLGGGGSAKHNVNNFEVLPRPNDHSFISGTVHNFSTHVNSKETMNLVRKQFPVVKGRVINDDPHCGAYRIPDFDPVTNETVQTTSLFGAGWLDLISDKAIVQNARTRSFKSALKEFSLDFNTIPVGKVRILDNGKVGKFGWKAQFATLEEFTAAACANELGLGTPISKQAKPLNDQKYEAESDLDKQQFYELVSFVKMLPRPVEEVPSDKNEAAKAKSGKSLFNQVGCAVCHVPDLGGVKGIYSDLLLYRLTDPEKSGSGSDAYDRVAPRELNLPHRPENLPLNSEWKTPPLWGVASSAPYMHDGSAGTLQDAILQHNGDAKKVKEEFSKLSVSDQEAVIAFLRTLKAPPTASPLSNPNVTKLVLK